MLPIPGSARRYVFLGLTIALPLCTLPTAAVETAFVIMSEQEADLHRAAMARLSGDERETYRNARYAELRQRAIDHGFQLPVEPPWITSATSPTEQAASRHAAMRAKLEARRLALQSSASAQPGDQGAHASAPHTRPVDTSTDTPKEPIATVTAADAQAGQPPARHAGTSAASEPPRPAEPAAVPAAPEQATDPVESEQPVMTLPIASPTGSMPAPTRHEHLNQPDPPTPPIRQTPSHAAEAPVPATASEPDGGAVSNRDAMDEYRQKMRARFDEFLQQRQAQRNETLRRQREQIETRAAKQRTWFPSGPRAPSYPYAVNPAYGPRQPPGLPAYRSPYWAPPR